jgi:hypothetical protein
LVGAAVADEGNGRAGAVSSLTSWLGDDGRFPAPWVRAVLETVSRARRLASKRGPRAAAPAGDSVPARGSVPPSRK